MHPLLCYLNAFYYEVAKSGKRTNQEKLRSIEVSPYISYFCGNVIDVLMGILLLELVEVVLTNDGQESVFIFFYII